MNIPLSSRRRNPIQSFTQQSPVDLKNPVYVPSLGDSVDIGWSAAESVPVKPNHGHGADMPGDQPRLVIDGKSFEPKGFHFHAHSEHTVNGAPYPMELHIVHKSDTDDTLAVVGVFIDDKGLSGSKADNSMKSLLRSLRGEQETHVSPADLLPGSTEKFYRYEGSLTTPPYDETVSWTVLKEPIQVAPETLTMLKDKHGHEAREPQDLNRRYILANFS